MAPASVTGSRTWSNTVRCPSLRSLPRPASARISPSGVDRFTTFAASRSHLDKSMGTSCGRLAARLVPDGVGQPHEP